MATINAGMYASIQDAINAAGVGDTVFIPDGDYVLDSTLIVNKDITLIGESEEGVVIDASGLDSYGILLTGDGATLSTFSLLGPATGLAAGNYGIKAQPAGSNPTDALTGITIEHVTVSGSLTSEIDLNGVDNSTLTDITVDGLGTGGVGIALTDSTGITLTDITTLGNAWGSIGLYTNGTWYQPGTGNIVFNGSYDHDESVGIYSEDESASVDPGAVTFPFATVYKVTNDILWRNDDGRLLTWLVEGSGAGFTVRPLGGPGGPEAAWRIAEADDFNGDGRADILWRHTDNTLVVWEINEFGGVQSRLLGPLDAGWHIVDTGDFDLDLDADILWRHEDGRVATYIPGPNGTFALNTFGQPELFWVIEKTGDFSGDGRTDILWRNDITQQVVVWDMTSPSSFVSRGYGTPEDFWRVVGTGDVNGDGQGDILWRNLEDDRIVTYEFDAMRSFPGFTLGTPESSWQVLNDPTGVI